MKLRERFYYFFHADEIKQKLENINNLPNLLANPKQRKIHIPKWDLFQKVQQSLLERGMTSKDLSEVTGIKKEWVSMLIRGKKRSREKEVKIAEVLGHEWDYFFDDCKTRKEKIV